MDEDSSKKTFKALTLEIEDANKELAFQYEEKEKRAAELLIANKELAFQNKEKEKRAQELLEINNLLFNERQLFEKTLISIGDGVISIDKNKNVIFLNTVAEGLTGWSKDEAFGQPVYRIFNIINEYTRAFDEDIVHKVMVNKTVHILANHTILISKDGSEKLIEDSASPILDKDNDITGVVIIFRDYTEKWERLKKIEFINYHDQLTGLYNRNFFEEELFRLDTSRNLPLSIVIGDINNLKLVNDSFGHLMGDELLKGVAQSIKDACREDDIIARMGGDEFSIILPKTSEEQTEKLIRRIKTNLSKFKIAGVEASVSFGHGCKKTEDQSIRDIMKAAEDSMYRSKFFGKASAQSRTINIITKTLFEKNNRELLHSERVSKLCELVARKLEFNEERLEMLKTAGLMHDIGKIAINESILNKKGKLSLEELDVIRTHPEIGFRILSSVSEFVKLSLCVLQHHEKWDGSGYPQSLKGEEISVEARILALADTYDAMTSLRTYRNTIKKDEAIIEIRKCLGSHFDPEIGEIFITILNENADI